jgi:NAD(P)-dependent dehydrogenase (short-subunit alcohol dehydrogenase family)
MPRLPVCLTHPAHLYTFYLPLSHSCRKPHNPSPSCLLYRSFVRFAGCGVPNIRLRLQEVQTAFRAGRMLTSASHFNAGFAVWKPFLNITKVKVDRVADTNVMAAFAFAREAITAFRGQAIIDEERGT